MPINDRSDRSTLPAPGVWAQKLVKSNASGAVDKGKTADKGKAADTTASSASSHVAAAAAPADIRGQVGGPSRGALHLAGRVVPAPGMQPGDAAGDPVIRGTHTHVLNRVLHAIESTRKVDGTLPAPALKCIAQLGLIVDACGLMSDGPAVSESLQQQMAGLMGLAGLPEESVPSQLHAGLASLHAAQAGDPVPGLAEVIQEIDAWTADVAAQATDRIKYLAQSMDSSPFSYSKHYQTKAGISEAAVSVLDEVIRNHKGDAASLATLERGRETLRHRADAMKGEAHRLAGQIARPEHFVDRKKLTGLSRLLHPFKARAESTARAGYATDLAAGRAAPLSTPGTNEMNVIEDALARILEDAKVADVHAHREVERAFQMVINANPAWNRRIHREIHLPVLATSLAKPDAATDLAISAPNGSPIAYQTCIAHSDITPAPALLPTYGGIGVNAHCSTEGMHAVNLAQTHLTDADGNPLFTGVRHGVLSAFGLTKEGVAGMSDEELWSVMDKLLPKEKWQQRGVMSPDGGQPNLRYVDDGRATLRAVRANPALVDTMRAAANRNRALEVVAMSVLSDPALRQAALEGGEPPPTVDLLSLSLLTPDSFRRGEHDNESLMLADQAAAWKAVSGEQTIAIPGADGRLVDVKVTVNPIAMNYGVNQGAVKGVGGVHIDAVSGWHISDPLNEQGLRALFGDDLSRLATSRTGILGERIAKLLAQHEAELSGAKQERDRIQLQIIRAGSQAPTDGDGKAAALMNDRLAQARARVSALEAMPADQSTPLGATLELQHQIAEIHAQEAHRKAGGEPYKMPTRLAVLADMLGVKVAFNCKSGKDRTGELDAEIKHFKLQMALTGTVPHHTRRRTPDEMRHFHEVVTNSGNFEVQQLNTGYAGYKLHGVPELFRQFGGQGSDALSRNYHGLSGYTAS